MKIEFTEEEIRKLYTACKQRSYWFADKAYEEGNDLRDTDKRLRDAYKALAEKIHAYIAE